MVYIKKILTGIWNIIAWPYRKIQEEVRWRKRLKELRKRDPFIYK
jgi:hypothetical protein